MMKKITLLLSLIFASATMFAQTVALEESFETDGNGTRYTTSTPEFTDGGFDFFKRTDGSDLPPQYEVTGEDGSFYFAAQDIDGEGAAATQTLDFSTINIAGLNNLTLALLVAEDDDGTNQDWDDDTLLTVSVQIDGGGYTPLIQFAAIGPESSNTEPALDTDFDGVGDGTRLSSAFQTFSADLNMTGNVADIRVTFTNLNAGDEDVSIDLIQLVDGFTATPTITITAPTDDQVFASGTTSVDVEWNTSNEPMGSTVDIIVDGTRTSNVTSPFAVPTSDGGMYDVSVELMDSMNAVISSDMVSFSVSFPCDLVVGDVTTMCDTQTAGTDTYTTSIPFSGGNTSTYTINTGGVGTVGGDDPSTTESGTITITGVDEGTDFTVNILGDSSNSGCDITRFVSGPSCVETAACPVEGAIIVTEILQNAIGSDTNKEYFEVYNTTASPIDMMGWIISDNGSDSFTVNTSVVVAPNAYVVFAQEDDPALNGGIANVSYEYGTEMFLSNGDDEVILSCSGSIIDQVLYDGGPSFPDPEGSSMELSISALNSADNDNGENWGEATTPYGDGTNNGTPGAQNDFVLGVDDLKAASFTLFPNPSNGDLNIKLSTPGEASIAIYSVLGKQVFAQQNISSQINVANLSAGLYLVKVSQNGATATQKLIVK